MQPCERHRAVAAGILVVAGLADAGSGRGIETCLPAVRASAGGPNAFVGLSRWRRTG